MPHSGAIATTIRVNGSGEAPAAAREGAGRSMEGAAGGVFKRARAERREGLRRPHAVRRRSRSLLRLAPPRRSGARLRVRDGPRRGLGSLRQGIPARHVSRRGRDGPQAAARATSRPPSTRSCSGSRKRRHPPIASSAISTAAAASPPGCDRSLAALRRSASRNPQLDPLPDESSAAPLRAASPPIDPDRARFVAAMRAVLAAAIAALEPRDRLRLACYYAQEMTLAQIGTLTREHEATVSRAAGANAQGDPRGRRAPVARRARILESRDRRMLCVDRR